MKVSKNQIKELAAQVLSNYNCVAGAYLYGSYAKNTMTPLSDIDIAVLLDEDYKPRTADKLNFELSLESKMIQQLPGYNIEVRILNEAPVLIQGQVIVEGILIYEKEKKRMLDFEEKVIIRYLDFKIDYDKLLNIRYKQEING